ncbi:longitudinals lacking protein, isoforms H/M/V [Drosophila albomicans]|uniref:Longitudinals lacking protein, isoforms H/M/V n=1 Tax=Drosophila albomicans TaxID=7291 RepID=A0A6P8XDE9_DROAB|nr:longitudinals lacking protein, isoforms H/M/V [Drosophila albomicans]XP_051860773.1 longitudinals lacking protein, isoforms H/M/V [Drosophila albomicans]
MGGPTPVAASSEGGQTYCLRWNNHQTNLVQILHALHEVGSYVDCTLVVDDEQFKAHRVVLAANSPYFQAILQDVPQDQCSIILPGVKGFEIAALLQYMYTGETTVTKSQEPEILRTAKELQVKGLYDNLMKFNNHKAAAVEERSHHQFEGSSQSHHHHHHQHSAPTSSSGSKSHNGAASEAGYQQQQPQHNSSSVISTSTHISPSAAISSSCSPPPPPFGSYQPPYTSFPPAHSSGVPLNMNAHIPAGETPLTPTHSTPHAAAAGEAGHGQWPLSPSAAAAAMLNSVYESAADMNPLKRKKLSAISSMLLNSTRDTPILRNVLAQANPADSSQPNPLLLPGVKSSSSSSAGADKTPTHQHPHSHQMGSGGGSAAGAGSHSFNGSDYGGDKEPLSPHTDRSFDEETGGQGGKKPEWKRYKQYTRADMMCAIQCVREGMSALQASRKFGLPSRTLYDKVRKLNITTGRGTHRTPKRSPPGVGGVESPAAFPYSAAAAAAAAAHNYGQPELERDVKEHGHGHPQGTGHAHHGMPPTIPHSAAALLDHAFLQQALENRGNDIAGREALHAMALAAAAHAAANRMSSSPPGSNGHVVRSPGHYAEQESMEKHGQAMIKREAIEEERDADDEDDHEQDHEHEHEHEQDHDQVEDLSLARKERPESPYSPPPPRAASPMESASVIMHSNSASASINGKEAHELEPEHENDHDMVEDYNRDEVVHSPAMVVGLKRELLGSDEAQARTD